MLRTALSRILATFRRQRLDEELNDEVRLHIEMLAERFTGRGMPPAEAYYAARRQFGGVTQMKEDLRERRALPPADVIVQDVRHAFRQLRKAKGFTASAALTLALGIGASTAVFAVLDAVVLRPLPYAQPDRLMAFRPIDRRGTPHPTSLSYPNFFDFRAQNRVFAHLVSYRDSRFTLTGTQPAIQVVGEIVSWDLFPLLGVQPELGRGFLPEEEKAGTHVAVLSDALWKSRFGGDRGILGRPVRINGRAYTVVGIAPRAFQFPLEVPGVLLWTTLSEDATVAEFTPMTEQRGARVLDAIGRLKPGITAEQARTQLDQVAGALARLYPDDNKNVATTQVKPELERLTGSSRKPLWILLGAVALVLLIACANVANLLLARSTERVREFALRMALGASRAAVLRQLLIESLALGLIGCAGGVLLALGALRAVLPLAGDSVPRIAQAGLNGPVLAFSILAALVTSVLFSTAPAMRAAGTDPAGTLKDGARGIALGHNRLRNILVVAQVALGLVLLVGAESLMGSFLHLARRDPGFRTDHLLIFGIGMPDTHYTTASTIRFSDRLRQSLREIPGVQAVATGFPLPLEGEEMTVSFDIEERPAAAPERPTSAIAIVTPGFFSTMGIAVRQGRDFTERDDANAPRVLIVNEAFAHKFFPGEEVLGKRIMPGATNGKEEMQMREIVGVVANAKQNALGVEPDAIYYFPYKQLSWDIGTIVLRTAGPPLPSASAARQALVGLDPEAAMYHVRSGDELAGAAVARPRFHMALMASFAAIALLLTVVGLYGVLSYSVARRVREIGVRIALGAGRTQILGLVLREAMQLVAAGLLLGLAGAAASARLLDSMMYGVRPEIRLLAAAACGAMAITGAIAAHVPAMRAASVDPMQALRSE